MGIRTGLIGAGVFGGLHAKKLAMANWADFHGIYDPDDARANNLAKTHNCTKFQKLDRLLAESEAVIIASPASFHGDLVEQAIEANCHILVEKPLALNGVDALFLAEQAERKGLILQVGHQERFVMCAMGIFDIPETPLSIEAVREGTYSERARDVSVVFDLMIHDLDLTAILSGDGKADMRSAFGELRDNMLEAADIQFQLNQTNIRLLAHRDAKARRRMMRLVFPSGAIELDFLSRKLINDTPFPIRMDISQTMADPLGAANNRFGKAIMNQTAPPITGREGAFAVRLAEQVEQACLGKMELDTLIDYGFGIAFDPFHCEPSKSVR